MSIAPSTRALAIGATAVAAAGTSFYLAGCFDSNPDCVQPTLLRSETLGSYVYDPVCPSPTFCSAAINGVINHSTLAATAVLATGIAAARSQFGRFSNWITEPLFGLTGDEQFDSKATQTLKPVVELPATLTSKPVRHAAVVSPDRILGTPMTAEEAVQFHYFSSANATAQVAPTPEVAVGPGIVSSNIDSPTLVAAPAVTFAVDEMGASFPRFVILPGVQDGNPCVLTIDLLTCNFNQLRDVLGDQTVTAMAKALVRMMNQSAAEQGYDLPAAEQRPMIQAAPSSSEVEEANENYQELSDEESTRI